MTCPFAADFEQDGDCPEEETLDYHSYLGLNKVLTANTRQSALKGREAHTEHLFITIHQVRLYFFFLVLTNVFPIRTLLLPKNNFSQANK